MLPLGCRPDLLFRSPREEHLANKDGCVEAFSRGSLLFSVAAAWGKVEMGSFVLLQRLLSHWVEKLAAAPFPSASSSDVEGLKEPRDLKSLGPWHCRPLQGSSLPRSLLYREEVWGGGGALAPDPFQSPFQCPGATIENRFSGNWVT